MSFHKGTHASAAGGILAKRRSLAPCSSSVLPSKEFELLKQTPKQPLPSRPQASREDQTQEPPALAPDNHRRLEPHPPRSPPPPSLKTTSAAEQRQRTDSQVCGIPPHRPMAQKIAPVPQKLSPRLPQKPVPVGLKPEIAHAQRHTPDSKMGFGPPPTPKLLQKPVPVALATRAGQNQQQQIEPKPGLVRLPRGKDQQHPLTQDTMKVLPLQEQQAHPGVEQPDNLQEMLHSQLPEAKRARLDGVPQAKAMLKGALGEPEHEHPAYPSSKMANSFAPQELFHSGLSETKSARPIGALHRINGPFPFDTPVRITLPNEYDAPDLLSGLSPHAIAFGIEGRKKNLYDQANKVLEHFFDDSWEERNIQYSEGNTMINDSWERFPGVGAALKARVLHAKENFCISVSRSWRMWAVGVSDTGRCRFQASRIALALSLCAKAIAAGGEVDLSEAPLFPDLLSEIGVAISLSEAPLTKKARQNPKSLGEADVQPLGAKAAAEPPFASSQASNRGTLAGSKFPRDKPAWISLEDRITKPELLANLPENALAVSGDGKLKGVCAKPDWADDVLALLLGWSNDDVELHDDPDGSKLPEVGTALKDISKTHESFCLAISHTHNCWTVGLGMDSETRQNAAKVALAATIYMITHEHSEDDDVDLSEFPEFSEFLNAVRASIKELAAS